MAETFLYLTTTGRRTGTPHTIEIWYVTHDDCHYLCAEHGEQSDWVKNIQHEVQVTFVIAEREMAQTPYPATGSIVTDKDLIEILSALFDAKYKWSNGLFVEICPKQN